MDNTEYINVLSLCTGYGGLELGLAAALQDPLRVVAVEVEAYALANLAAKAEAGKLAIEAMWPDLRTFPAERFRGCFDFIIAGYPCQPFSHAGKRGGESDPRHLWPHIAGIIKAVQPVYCFFENVSGHLSLGYPEVYRSLRLMGYKVEAGLFTAAEVGAPHKRQRLFILAKSSESGTRNILRKTGRGHRSEDVRQENRQACTGRTDTTSELAHDSNGGRETMQIQQARQSTSGNGCEDLGNARGTKSGRLPSDERQEIPEVGNTGELADAEEAERRRLPEKHTGRRTKEIRGPTGMWPARPGQPQYQWEEPRVIVEQPNGSRPYIDVSVRQSNKSRLATKAARTSNRKTTCIKEQIESGVGRAVNGPGSRVDRLRLLGNGVVPEQAEKAYRELWKKF